MTTHYLSLSSYGLYDAGGNGWQYNEYNGTSYADFEGGSNGNSGYYSGGIGYPAPRTRTTRADTPPIPPVSASTTWER